MWPLVPPTSSLSVPLHHVLTITMVGKDMQRRRSGLSFGRGRESAVVPHAERPRPGTKGLRVPSSKELQRMRQFRQNQMFRQQQQMAKRLVEKGEKGEIKGDGMGEGGLSVGGVGGGKKKSVGGNKASSASTKSSGGGGNSSSKALASPPSKSGGGKKKRPPPTPVGSLSAIVKDGRTKEGWAAFASDNGFESTWRAQVHILSELGFTPQQLAKISNSRVEIFNTSSKTLTRKIEFFREALSMSDGEIVKLISKSPRVLEYSS